MFLSAEDLNVLKFVLRVFMDVPDEKLLRGITQIDSEGYLEEIKEEILSIGIDNAEEAYNNEFLELFVQPRSLKTIPNASHHIEKEKFAQIDYINELKLLYAENQYKAIPPFLEDHIATELSFFISDIPDSVRRDFYEKHISKWAGNFCNHIISESKYKYFSNTAKLFLSFLESVEHLVNDEK